MTMATSLPRMRRRDSTATQGRATPCRRRRAACSSSAAGSCPARAASDLQADPVLAQLEAHDAAAVEEVAPLADGEHQPVANAGQLAHGGRVAVAGHEDDLAAARLRAASRRCAPPAPARAARSPAHYLPQRTAERIGRRARRAGTARPASAKAFSGHSTKWVKWKRKVALRSYSRAPRGPLLSPASGEATSSSSSRRSCAARRSAPPGHLRVDAALDLVARRRGAELGVLPCSRFWPTSASSQPPGRRQPRRRSSSV